MMKCPGQDMRNWKPGDIFDADCPFCGHAVEFFKDEATRRCSACGGKVVNPRMDLGCAEHCPSAGQCLGSVKQDCTAADPKREKK